MVRLATAADADFIAELEILLFPDNCINERVVRNEIEHGISYLVEGKGYLLARWDGELLDILRVGVHPSYQRQGVGLELMKHILATSPGPAMLTVREDNEGAKALYFRLGFRLAGWKPQAKAFIMRR